MTHLLIIHLFAANVYLTELPKNTSVASGKELKIHCQAHGTEPKITWKIGALCSIYSFEKMKCFFVLSPLFLYFLNNSDLYSKLGGNKIVNTSHVHLSEDDGHIKDAILTIAHAEKNDTNLYSCSARNEATDHKNYTGVTAETFVTVSK